MKIFISIFAVFFFFSLSVAYSWTFYLSATIHKSYMFLLCNGLLVFILNSRSTVSPEPERDYGRELAEKKQAEAERYFQSGPMDISRAVGEVGDEKETESLYVVQVREDQILIAEDDDEKAGETQYDELQVMEDGMTLSIVEETRDDELEVVEDDMTFFVVEETRDDELEVVEDDMTLFVVEETQDDELEAVEDDVTLLIVEETQDDDDKTLSVVEETRNDDEQEQGRGIDMISLEELNKKFEEFIRTTKRKIRAELLTIQCY